MNRRLVTAGLAALAAFATLSSSAQVVINEIAWGGSETEHTDEWIELVNASDRPIDLSGWQLVSSDGAPNLLLSGVLPPRAEDDPGAGYLLLERDDDDSVSAFRADAIYTGALNDSGETLFLYGPDGALADSANASISPGEPRPWPGGTGGLGASRPHSMERIDPLSPDAPENWATCSCHGDSDCASLPCGTPKRENSVYNVPPTASMTIVPQFPSPAVAVRFDASSSEDRNDDISTFSWSFGDGATGEGQTASHTYDSEGEYSVVLTTHDSLGATASTIRTLFVYFPAPPMVDFSLLLSSPDELPRAGAPLEFIDETSSGPAGLVTWIWNFGDGATAEGERAVHEYASTGTYDVRLEVADAQGSRAAATVTVHIASRIPSAHFTVETEPLSDGLPIQFDASASSDPDGEVAHYLWDFDGDGSMDLTTEDDRVEHVYEISGPLTPTLLVEDGNGDRSAPYCVAIHLNARPVAQFAVSTFSPRELEMVEFIDASSDADGAIQDWHWDFGDGESSPQTSPTHAFQSSGPHTVTVTVFDDQGASRAAVATIHVANLPPKASIESGSEDGETGIAFTFDAADSFDPSPEGAIVLYEWDVDGDGDFDSETAVPSFSHVYTEDGTYDVSVRVTDDREETAVSDSIRITVRNRPPVVRRIRWTPERPFDGDEVIFTAEASDSDGEITGWEWIFGDEASSTHPEPHHAFANDKTYVIRLVVRDNDGAPSEPISVEIDVANAVPIAQFTYAVIGPGTVTFSAMQAQDTSPNGRIVHIAWDFGDGTSCPGDPSACGNADRSSPIHIYAQPGTYAVTLVLIDDDGGIGQATQIVTIP